MADCWSLRSSAAGIVVARARMTWSPGLAIRRLLGWADSASDTIVTVRRRPWGQIRHFGAAFCRCILRPNASITVSSIPSTAASRSRLPGNPHRGGTVTAHGCAQQVSAAFAALPGSGVLTWDGAQRMVTAFAGFRRLTASAPQPKCDLRYVE